MNLSGFPTFVTWNVLLYFLFIVKNTWFWLFPVSDLFIRFKKKPQMADEKIRLAGGSSHIDHTNTERLINASHAAKALNPSSVNSKDLEVRFIFFYSSKNLLLLFYQFNPRFLSTQTRGWVRYEKRKCLCKWFKFRLLCIGLTNNEVLVKGCCLLRCRSPRFRRSHFFFGVLLLKIDHQKKGAKNCTLPFLAVQNWM